MLWFIKAGRKQTNNAQPYLAGRYFKWLSHKKLLCTGDCSALSEFVPHGTAIVLISNQFDIKPVFGTSRDLSCARVLAPRGIAVVR